MTQNLLNENTPPTLLPEDPAAAEVKQAAEGEISPYAVTAKYPASSAAWALLAQMAVQDLAEMADEESKEIDDDDAEEMRLAITVTAYACARTGYHRGLDALRRSGWRGSGPVPWDHEPNQGFLRCVELLADSASLIGETEEAERCTKFLEELSA